MRFTLVALMLCLTACGASTATNSAPADSSSAATADGAVAFVRRALTETDGAHSFYAPSLQNLIDETGRLFPEEPVVDYDPVCQCQDMMEQPIDLAATPRGANAFAVRVRDTHNPARDEWSVITTYADGAWGVTDVIEQEQGSFVARIGRINACARARQAQGQTTEACVP